MNKNMLLLLVLVGAFVIGACSAQLVEETPSPEPERSFAEYDHECTQEEIVAEACTREYAPVCGNDNQTHSNGCTACGTPGVYAYNYGACDPKDDIVRPDFDEDACGAVELQGYLGLAIEEMDVANYSDSYRVIRPGDAVTLDYRVERLNVYLDESDRIETITCG